jgi:PEP-CTERM motif
MKKILFIATAALVAISAGSANAAVRYDFEAFSSFPLGIPNDVVSGGFSVTLADFVISPTTVQASSLSSCFAFGSASGVLPCGNQILATQAGFDDYILFGFAQPQGPAQVAYYFGEGALSSVGIYLTTAFGPDQAGRLTVTLVGGAVPEPASWAMMIAGFGLVGAAMRRRATKISYA